MKGLFCFFFVIGITLLGMANNSAADLNDSLVAYYPFNENANDESGNGNHGTVNGATLTTDRFGNENSAYSFDGSNDYIIVQDNDSLNITENFSIGAWIKPDTLNEYNMILDKHKAGINSDGSWYISITNEKVEFAGTNDSSSWNYGTSLTTINASTWNFVGITFDDSTNSWKVYINGVLDKSSTRNFDLRNTSRNLYIGAQEDVNDLSTYFTGIIDDIRIYNRTLSDSEIQELYNEGSTYTPTPTPTPEEGMLFGFVYDEDKNPLKGVTVTLAGGGYSGSSETDDNGYYEFSNLSAGDYTITYEKEDYRTQTVEVTLEEDDKKAVDAVFMEYAEKGNIYGYVVDIKGYPVKLVRLKLRGIVTRTVKRAATDADGFFEFADLDADTYVILASKKHYKKAKSKVKIKEGEDKEVEIKIRKTTKRGVLVKE